MDVVTKLSIWRYRARGAGWLGIGIVMILMGPVLTAGATPGEPLTASRIFAADQPTSGAYIGASIAALGDVDGDGVNDLAVGSHNDEPSTTTQGYGSIRILFMKADGTVRERVTLRPPAGEAWGHALAPLGDIDGDGTPDLATGDAGIGFYDPGAVTILFLDPSGAIRDRQTIVNPVPPGPNQSHFGVSVSRVGDLDGDGVVDLAVGVDTFNNQYLVTYSLCLLRLHADGTLKDWSILSDGDEPFASILKGAHYYFGASVAPLGDINHDGDPELAIGCPYPPQTGMVYIYDVAPGLVLVTSIHNLDSVTTVTVIEDPKYDPPYIFPYQGIDMFGHATATAGDLDGDGVEDLVVANLWPEDVSPTPQDDAGGVAWVFLLNADGTVKAQHIMNRVTPPLDGQIAPGDQFGAAVAMAGDLDKDQRLELAVTAPGDSTLASHAGAVWMISLDSINYPAMPELLDILLKNTQPAPGLMSVFDINQDGVVDIADLIALKLPRPTGG